SDKPSLETVMPQVFKQFVATTQLLEKHYRDMQDMEFTVERGKLWMLQTRNGKRTAQRAARSSSRPTRPRRFRRLATRCCWCASRPRLRTFTACTPPRAS